MAEANSIDKTECLLNLNRSEYADIAEDTLNILNVGWYSPSKRSRINLSEDIQFSNNNSILYTEDDLNNRTNLISKTNENISDPIIEVHLCTTLQAAQDLVVEQGEQNVGVLNFASAKNPGGGFRKGSCAQEESLARSSSLYLSITQDRLYNEFYDYHRRGKSALYSHRMIYSPRVTIFKDDNGKLLSTPYHVGIVTCPAPNAGVVRDDPLVRSTMNERIERVLTVFEMNKHETLVLGAFGCGVFKNDPLAVAFMFKQHLQSDRFKYSFKRIIFAILNPDMYHIFKEVFSNNIDLTDLKQQLAQTSLNHNENQHSQKSRKSGRNEKNNRKQAHLKKYQHHFNDDE